MFLPAGVSRAAFTQQQHNCMTRYRALLSNRVHLFMRLCLDIDHVPMRIQHTTQVVPTCLNLIKQ